jgi:hypothetical protein
MFDYPGRTETEARSLSEFVSSLVVQYKPDWAFPYQRSRNADVDVAEFARLVAAEAPA